MGLFLHTTKFQFYYFICLIIVQYVYLSCYTGLNAESSIFMRYRQLDVGGVTLYDKG